MSPGWVCLGLSLLMSSETPSYHFHAQTWFTLHWALLLSSLHLHLEIKNHYFLDQIIVGFQKQIHEDRKGLVFFFW